MSEFSGPLAMYILLLWLLTYTFLPVIRLLCEYKPFVSCESFQQTLKVINVQLTQLAMTQNSYTASSTLPPITNGPKYFLVQIYKEACLTKNICLCYMT